MIKFWVRLIIRGRISKLSFLMYCCLWQLYQEGLYSSPWLTHIRNICNNCGMSWVWDSQTVVNATWFKKAVEIRMKDQWITLWNANLASKSICCSYKIYNNILLLTINWVRPTEFWLQSFVLLTISSQSLWEDTIILVERIVSVRNIWQII